MAHTRAVDDLISTHPAGHFLRVSETARFLDVSRQRVEALIREGKLPAVPNPLSSSHPPAILIPYGAVKAYALRMPRPGRKMGRTNKPR